MTVIGTRPEAIKLAPVLKVLERDPRFESTVLITGQHNDWVQPILEQFGLESDFDLGSATGGSLSRSVGAMLIGIEPILKDQDPDWVLVEGDTATVMAAALGAFFERQRIGHVEAGLRSGDIHTPFPEELERRVTGLMADIHFAPTEGAAQNLRAEGVPEDQIVLTGNTVIDACHEIRTMDFDPAGTPLECLPLDKRIVLATAHRRENHGERIEEIAAGIRELALDAEDAHVVFLTHLNPAVREPVERILADVPNLSLLPPLDYRSLTWLLERSYFVITDSGGLQEEAAAFEKPVLLLREQTERPEGVEQGIAKLVGTDKDAIVREGERLLADPEAYGRMVASGCPYGDGYAAVRIVTSLAAREWPTASTWELASGSSTMVSNVPAARPNEPVRFTGPQEPPPVRVVLDVRIPELEALQATAPERRGEDPSPIAVSVTEEQGPQPPREPVGDGYMSYARKLDDGIKGLLESPDKGLLESPDRAEDERYTDELVDIDFRLKTATAHGRNLELTPTEFRLLTALVRNNDRVLSHEELLDLAWSKARKRSRQQVKLYVGYLRRKLRGVADANPIQTVRGYGYRYRLGPAPTP